MAKSSSLTKNDGAVLAQIFDPESAPSKGILIDDSLPGDPVITDERIVREIREKEKTIIKDVERAMASHDADARRKTLSKSFQELKSLSEVYPESASLRNDLAQVFRLQYGDSVLASSPNNPTTRDLASATLEVLDGLSSAIKMVSPATPQMAMSPTQCRTLAQMHMQRGALYHAAAKELGKQDNVAKSVVLPGWTALDFEEAASRDFFMGGRYGNGLGKALAVHTNPTAKLCGQIVQEAIRREYNS